MIDAASNREIDRRYLQAAASGLGSIFQSIPLAPTPEDRASSLHKPIVTGRIVKRVGYYFAWIIRRVFRDDLRRRFQIASLLIALICIEEQTISPEATSI